jgi:hypothetical protein
MSGGTSPPPSLERRFEVIRDPSLQEKYQSKRIALEAAFLELLKNATVLASGIDRFSAGREPINPSLWELLEVNYDFDSIVGSGREYEQAEFFEPSAIPLNIRTIPAWLTGELVAANEGFRHSSDFRHIEIGNLKFVLGPIQAGVVKLLHEAARDEWLSGKEILEKAGSTQSKMHDVFKTQKNWHALIESDGRGYYRLRGV